MSVTAYRQALLLGRLWNGGRVPPVWECFPFWTAEETTALKTEQIARMLRGMGVKENA